MIKLNLWLIIVRKSNTEQSGLLGFWGVCWKLSGQGLEDFQRLKRVDIICRGMLTWVRLLIGWPSETCLLEGALIG